MAARFLGILHGIAVAKTDWCLNSTGVLAVHTMLACAKAS
jgi:hypothetical protein